MTTKYKTFQSSLVWVNVNVTIFNSQVLRRSTHYILLRNHIKWQGVMFSFAETRVESTVSLAMAMDCLYINDGQVKLECRSLMVEMNWSVTSCDSIQLELRLTTLISTCQNESQSRYNIAIEGVAIKVCARKTEGRVLLVIIYEYGGFSGNIIHLYSSQYLHGLLGFASMSTSCLSPASNMCLIMDQVDMLATMK